MGVRNGVIALSELELDLIPPEVIIRGWDAYLADRGIPVVSDDIGRRAVTDTDARQLITEWREVDARSG